MPWPHWSVYVVLFAAWFWQNAVHELSHLIAAWRYHRAKPLGFYPYPHKYKGRFYFARYECEPFPLPGHPWVHAAPVVGALVQYLVVAWALLFLEFCEVGDLWWYWAVLTLCPIVDMLWWVRSYYWGSPESDGWRFKASIWFMERGGRFE